MRILLAALLITVSCAAAHAHSQSSGRLYLDTRSGSVAVDLALVDLLQVVDLDRDADGSVTWREVKSSETALVTYVIAGVRVAAGDVPCRLTPSRRSLSLVSYASVPHVRIALDMGCPGARAHRVLRYGLLFDVNPDHRALVHVTGGSVQGAWVLSPDQAEICLSGDARLLAAGAGFAAEGVRHILSGYDHLVFLLLLILPCAGQGALRARVLSIAAIVTAFTLAHSITLAAATVELVRLPARPVEIGIAASILVAAILNIAHPTHRLGWKVAFAFGLLHGFGFAGALADMNLAPGTLLVGLLSFNLGVEAGQLLIVAVIVPILALLSASSRYRSMVVPSASLACAVLGAVWTAARF